MILADTSAWVDYFRGSGSQAAEALDRALDTEEIVLGDLILVEILQGIRPGHEERLVKYTLASLDIRTLCGPAIAELAASNYRLLRRAGITIRGTIDVVIATWCIENGVPLLHNDRDFASMEMALGLKGWR